MNPTVSFALTTSAFEREDVFAKNRERMDILRKVAACSER